MKKAINFLVGTAAVVAVSAGVAGVTSYALMQPEQNNTLAFDDDRLIGYSALHIHAANLAEVRSLIVDGAYRGKGVGSGLVNALLAQARELEIAQVFTLTYRSEFFKNLGFEEISKEKLPAQKIWADCIKCKHFPVCNEIALIQNL